MLETKLELLQGQGVGRSNVEPMFEAYMAGLRRQMDLVNNDKTKLDGELRNMQGLVEDYKHKYMMSPCWCALSTTSSVKSGIISVSCLSQVRRGD